MGDSFCACEVLPSLAATLHSPTIIRPTARFLSLRNLRQSSDSRRWPPFQQSSSEAVRELTLQTSSWLARFPSKYPVKTSQNRARPSPCSPRRVHRSANPTGRVYCSHSQLFSNLCSQLQSSVALLSEASDLLNSSSSGAPLLDLAHVHHPSSTLTQTVSIATNAIDSVWILGQQIATASSQLLSQIMHLPSSDLSVLGSDHFLGDLAVALQGYSDTLDNPLASATAVLISVAGSAIAASSRRNSRGFKDVGKSKVDLEVASSIESRDAPSLWNQYPANTNYLMQKSYEDDFLPKQYDPEAIANYFRKRPFLVLSRATHIMAECLFLIANILSDLSLGKLKENESARAAQLVTMMTRLGPTAVKLGQALSARPDIIPATYLEALQKLQDRVPPFSNEEAKQLILEELGRSVEELYSTFSAEPVAVASFGQVYRAKLRTSGEAVAVKVQRPNVLEAISLDLHILRAVAKGLERFPNINSDLLPLLDDWADHVFHELDYRQEAKNAAEFGESMKSLPNVMVPKVYMGNTTCKVLTTSWVEGTKLSECGEDDLAKLVPTCLNCFLMQLLDSGFLHADPHPGNFLCTPDGRLCVLDFGLMIRVTEEQRYALIDFISHMIHEDHEKVADDFIKLGFVPPELVNQELTKVVLPQLSKVLSQLVQGGGLKGMDVQQIMDELAGIASKYALVIPPYFALILQAFSILEGVGLKSDPNYAIVEECYPYISRRLLTDDSPRARKALKYLVYGDREQLDVQRVEAILEGFQSFNKSKRATTDIKKSKSKVSSIGFASNELLSSLFAPEGSFVQEILLTELVRAVDALSREALFELWGVLNITIFPFAYVLPSSYLPSPMQSLFFNMRSVTRRSDEDERALKVVGRLLELISPQLNHQTIADMTVAAHRFPAVMPDLASGVTTASLRFLMMLLHRKALRLADDLDGKNSLSYWNRDPVASARLVKPLTLTSTAKFKPQLKP